MMLDEKSGRDIHTVGTKGAPGNLLDKSPQNVLILRICAYVNSTESEENKIFTNDYPADSNSITITLSAGEKRIIK